MELAEVRAVAPLKATRFGVGVIHVIRVTRLGDLLELWANF